MIRRLIVGAILGLILLFPIEVYPNSLGEMQAIREKVGPSAQIVVVPSYRCYNTYIVKKEDNSIWVYTAFKYRSAGKWLWEVQKAQLFQGGK